MPLKRLSPWTITTRSSKVQPITPPSTPLPDGGDTCSYEGQHIQSLSEDGSTECRKGFAARILDSSYSSQDVNNESALQSPVCDAVIGIDDSTLYVVETPDNDVPTPPYSSVNISMARYNRYNATGSCNTIRQTAGSRIMTAPPLSITPARVIQVPVEWLTRFQDCLVLGFVVAVIVTCAQPCAAPDSVLTVLGYPDHHGSWYLHYLAVAAGVASITLFKALLRMLRAGWGENKQANPVYMIWRNVIVAMFAALVFNILLLSQAAKPQAWAPETGIYHFDEQDFRNGAYKHIRLVWPLRTVVWAVMACQTLGSVGAACGLSYLFIMMGQVSALLSMMCLYGATMLPFGNPLNEFCLSLAVLGGLGTFSIVFKLLHVARTRVLHARHIARWQILFLTTAYFGSVASFQVLYILSRLNILAMDAELAVWPVLETMVHAALQLTCASIAEAYVVQKSALDNEAGANMLTRANIENCYPVNETTTVTDIVETVADYLKPIAAFHNIRIDVKSDIQSDQLVSMHPHWFETVVTTLINLAIELAHPTDSILVSLSRYETQYRGDQAWYVQTCVSCNKAALDVRKLGINALVLQPNEKGPAMRGMFGASFVSPAGTFLFALQREEGSGFQEGFSSAADQSISSRLNWASQLMVRSGGALGIRTTGDHSCFVVDVPAADAEKGGFGSEIDMWEMGSQYSAAAPVHESAL